MVALLGCQPQAEEPAEKLIAKVACVVDVSNVAPKQPQSIGKLRRAGKKRTKFFSRLSSNEFFPLPATEFIDIENPSIHFIVVSYYSCNETIEKVQTHFARKNGFKPMVQVSDLDTYVAVLRGENIFAAEDN